MGWGWGWGGSRRGRWCGNNALGAGEGLRQGGGLGEGWRMVGSRVSMGERLGLQGTAGARHGGRRELVKCLQPGARAGG